MQRQFKEYTLFDAVTPVAVTSSTDATPIVVTATAHGLVTGDKVQIFGHATNVAANGIFSVVKVTDNTFQLKDVNTGASVAGTGGGAGTGGVLVKNPKVVLVQDFTNVELQVSSAGTATWTAKLAGSFGKTLTNQDANGDVPNFGATISATANPYSLIQVIDLSDNSAKDGSTGIVVAGTDIHKAYEANINALKYVNLIVTSFTQGSITAKLVAYTI